MTDIPKTNVQTPAAILSYPHLFEKWKPRTAPENQKARYSCALVFVDTIMQQFEGLGTDLKKLKEAVLNAGTARWPNFVELYKKGTLKSPFRDDAESKGYPEGATFINTGSDRKPGIVMPQAGADGKPMILTDEALIYPGCIVRASLNAFAYDNTGRGVSFGLNNIQWLGHGERLDNVVAPSDDFDALEEVAPADIDDLL